MAIRISSAGHSSSMVCSIRSSASRPKVSWEPSSATRSSSGSPHRWKKSSKPEATSSKTRGARWIEGYGVLKPGVTIEQAQAEISTIAARLDAQYPATNRNRGVRLFPLWQTPFNGAGTMLSTLRVSFFVSCLVLLIACANVANLLLVRSVARRQEMTIRLSIGAGRMRLLRQLLTEGLVLAALAAGGGVLVAHWARDLM